MKPPSHRREEELLFPRNSASEEEKEEAEEKVLAAGELNFVLFQLNAINQRTIANKVNTRDPSESDGKIRSLVNKLQICQKQNFFLQCMNFYLRRISMKKQWLIFQLQ